MKARSGDIHVLNSLSMQSVRAWRTLFANPSQLENYTWRDYMANQVWLRCSSYGPRFTDSWYSAIARCPDRDRAVETLIRADDLSFRNISAKLSPWHLGSVDGHVVLDR